jgi:uncharacterized tellurite resistance protein B-like protein
MSEGQVTLALLHDMALLYLGLAHGADGDLHPEETHEIAAKLRRWQPDKDPALIDHVIREASLTYLNGTNVARVEEAVDTLKDSLPETLRQAVLRDLADIARADGAVVSGESDFIRSLAQAWRLNYRTADQHP